MSDRREAQTTAGAAVLFRKDCEGPPLERANRPSSPRDSPTESGTIFGGGELSGIEFEERRDTGKLDDVQTLCSPTREFKIAATGQKYAETLLRVEGVF